MKNSSTHEIELTLAPSHAVATEESQLRDQEPETDGVSQTEGGAESAFKHPPSLRTRRRQREQEGQMCKSASHDFALRGGGSGNDQELVGDSACADSAGETASCVREVSYRMASRNAAVHSVTQQKLFADLHKVLLASIAVSTLVAGLQLTAIFYGKASVQEDDESAFHAFMRTYPHAGISVFLCTPSWLSSIAADFALLPLVNALQAGERCLAEERLGLRKYFYIFRYGSLLWICAVSVVIAVIGCYVDPQMVALSSLPTLKRELFDGLFFWLGAVVPFVCSVAVAVPKVEILSSVCDLADGAAEDRAGLRQHASQFGGYSSNVSSDNDVSSSNSSSENNDDDDDDDNNDVESGQVEALPSSSAGPAPAA